MNIDWKEKLSATFSEELKNLPTEPNEPETVASNQPNKQELRICVEQKGRNGKTATIVYGYQGDEEGLAELARILKKKCGVGGSHRGEEILIQGDFREKVLALLKEMGHKARIV